MLTRNELLAALNTPEAFILAIVRVQSGFAHQPACVTRLFQREPGFAETTTAFTISDRLTLGAAPR